MITAAASVISSSLCLTISNKNAFLRQTSVDPSPRRQKRRRHIRCVFFSNHLCSSPLLKDACVTAAVTAGSYSLLRSFDLLAEKNFIEQKLSRKIVHILSGLLFMSSWPIFSSSIEARFFAASVPLVNCIRLLACGFSLVTNNEGLVKSMCREGKPEELLRGPLYYVLVLTFCTLIFWCNSPVGVISLAMMSGGDGFADIVGRRFGARKLPYNRNKSWVGSTCMFLSGFSFSMAMIYYFSVMGYLQLDWRWTMEGVALVSLVSTIVESLPLEDFVDDNISVPLSSMLTAILYFGY